MILWKSRSALLPSFREVINVRTFTCPEKVFPSAHWRIPSYSEIALRLGLPEQQCMQGKTDEDGSQQYQICYANIHETRPSKMEVYHRGLQEHKRLQMATWNDLNKGIEKNKKHN